MNRFRPIPSTKEKRRPSWIPAGVYPVRRYGAGMTVGGKEVSFRGILPNSFIMEGPTYGGLTGGSDDVSPRDEILHLGYTELSEGVQNARRGKEVQEISLLPG